MPLRQNQDRLLDSYELDTLGLPYPVTIRPGIVERLDPATGGVLGYGIPDLDGLLAAVAVIRILHPVRLSGREVRFLKRLLGKPGAALAGELGVEPAVVSRWEAE